MMPARVDARHRGRPSPYVVLLIGIWTAVMAARLYPQFDVAVRIDGRQTTVGEYITARCGARLGLAAETCFAAAERKAHLQLRREQAKSVLMIGAPAVLYLLCLGLAAAGGLRRRNAEPSKASP